MTEFRGRSDEIRVHPLSFAEFYSFVGGDKHEAFDEYAFYGGLPPVLSKPDDASKMNYLISLFREVYLKDIVERKRVEREDILDKVFAVKAYMDYLEDAFLFSQSKRYDVKGKAYFDFPNKYYCEDVGLRNARIEFRQQEMTRIMENIVYNELIIRGFSVDVGVVFSREKIRMAIW